MNANAKKWVEALRSKKYKQTTGKLRRVLPPGGDGYCCLGIACDLYHEATGKGTWQRDKGMSGIYEFKINKRKEGEVAGLPDAVAKWLGIKTQDKGLVSLPINLDQLDPSNLAHANDRGFKFHQIAKLIEKYASFIFKDEA